MENMKEFNSEELSNVTGGRGGSVNPLAPRDDCDVYRIQRGDTLLRIARRNHVTVDDILAVNTTIYDRNDITAGDYIYIPR